MAKVWAMLSVVAWAVLAVACSDSSDVGDDDGNAESPDMMMTESGENEQAVEGDSELAAGNGGMAATGDASFDACIAEVQQSCNIREMDTPEKMETPCFDLTFLPIPLTDGSMHGPVTLEGGPYGGKVEWNEGAGTDFVNPVNIAEPACLPFGIDSFNEPAAVTDDLKNVRNIDYSLYTIFRPACMKDGEKYPVITWANGTCGLTHGYAPLLATVASYGFVIIASNSSWTATPPTDGVQLRALDYAAALNEDPESIYYQKLDLDKVGAMGHSQGAGATAVAAADPRIKAIILWNGGTSNDKPFLYVSGERDIGDNGPGALEEGTNRATKPGAWLYHHQVLVTGGTSTGHLVLMEEPERVWQLTVDWWKYMLLDDPEAKAMFVGDDCGLCNRDEEFEFGHNSLLQ